MKKLAELVDVTPFYISNIESGNRIASLPTMLKIAKTLDISLDYLLLDNLTKNSNEMNIDKLLIEFKAILNNEESIKEYIIYYKGIANSMIGINQNN